MASAEGLVAQLDALLATTVAQEAFDKLGRRLVVASRRSEELSAEAKDGC